MTVGEAFNLLTINFGEMCHNFVVLFHLNSFTNKMRCLVGRWKKRKCDLLPCCYALFFRTLIFTHCSYWFNNNISRLPRVR